MPTLKEIIIEEIKSAGPMRVDRYMELCLTHHEHGYYIKQDPFGAMGDFTTSPEISQVFGEMLGVWCVSRWEKAGKPKDCAIVELGPGRGTMMNDLLRSIKTTEEFKPEIHLVEISPILRAMQRHKLRNHTVNWHDSFPQLNNAIIVIANEFFDALPIRQFIGDKERMIITDGENLAFNMVAEEGLTREVCEQGQRIMEEISERSMAGAIIDYGYMDSKMTDTLQAVKRHQFVPVLENPGDVDLTAHVDFAALTKCSKKRASLYTQREFLLGLRADLRAKILNREFDLERLIDPEQMGKLFKVLCF